MSRKYIIRLTEKRSQVLSGIRVLCRSNLFRSAGGHYASPVISSLRSEVNYIIRAFYHLKVVLYHYYAVAGVDKPVKNVEEFSYVVDVKSDRGLVKDVEDVVFFFFREFPGYLYPLGLSSRQRCCGLSEPQIAASDIL